ncbi:MAG: maltose alpha-D-glucosyltransferase [Actinomycetota bacterium]|nr:maltose alpha-D-glucosyltransferase [Actinomycetota bacterium]
MTREPVILRDDPLWYQDAVIYELHVRAFADSDGDGVGDFRGLTGRLEYLQDLGVTAIWLLPFYPSPLRDDGYDIADYTGIHPSYGTMGDFRAFLREAHRRGLRVITELIINHTSDQHPWFQRARRAPAGSRQRDFYVWSDTAEQYQEARIIFADTESSNWAWDPVAKAYYWHRFFSHQPDLNYQNPAVRKAIRQVLDFWLEIGVDGLRLDAIPYLYEREGTMCENLPETHQYLRELRRHVDQSFDNRMLLAEANQWPEDASAYFGSGDECHMAFHFPLMPRLFMALRMENRFPVIDILQQTPKIPEICQWALFLRNHDELTLEMVTDEERDYMYRSYAEDRQARINLGIRRRLAPLLRNGRRQIELMNAVLLSLPGTPVVYYGDEIGMGDNIYLGDRNSVRTPMQWSSDRNGGFSRANPQQLYLPLIIDPEYHYETVNVEAQQNNPHSLLWWMKRVIAQRKRFRVFGRGTLEFLYPDNPKVLAFLREHGQRSVLVVANLSRFVQCVELDLGQFRGTVPVELFGRTEFPPIGELPYFLTLGPHAFYWLWLEREPELAMEDPERRVPVLELAGAVDTTFKGTAKAHLEALLAADLPRRRWFAGKALTIQRVRVSEAIPFPLADEESFLTLLEVEYVDSPSETYLLPLAFAFGDQAHRVAHDHPRALIARLRTSQDEEGVLFDAMWSAGFAEGLLEAVRRRRRFKGSHGEVRAQPSAVLRELVGHNLTSLHPTVLGAEQSNTSLLYGDRLVLKLFRRLEAGVNPDLEIGRFLTERAHFEHSPPMAGSLEYRVGRKEPITLAGLQGYVHNEGDAWRYTLDELGRYYEQALTAEAGLVPPVAEANLLDLMEMEAPDLAHDLIGPYLQSADLLGRRTAQLHLALGSELEDPDFVPEPMSTLYQRSLYQSMRTLGRQTFHLLRRRMPRLPDHVRDEAQAVLDQEGEVLRRFQAVHEEKIDTTRIRCHGDYHLGQVLHTGKDFVIIDFEGEPARPLSERRLKRSPLRDVAGMLRSFHYAAYAALFEQTARGIISGRPEALEEVEPWVRYWYQWTAAAFLRSYLDETAGHPIVPKDLGQLRVLLDAFLLEKAVYELGYELNSRPEWVRIPLQGIRHQLQ